MSKLIALSDNRFIAADFIAEVRPYSDTQNIQVKMKDGTIYNHKPDYGSSVSRTADKLILEINEALK